MNAASLNHTSHQQIATASSPDSIQLSEHDLAAVAGGMECKTALKLADAYIAFGNVFQALGNSALAASYYGRAQGVLEGGCGK